METCTLRGGQFCSVHSLSSVRLRDPMDCSTPSFLVHHQLPELAQTHVHAAGDAKRRKVSPTAKGRPAQPDLAGAAIRGVRPHFQSGLALWQVFGFVQIP